MFRHRKILQSALITGLAVASLSPTFSFAQTQPLNQRETAVAPETNPPGDIPDNQAFITYTSPSGFSMQVPEGWSRSDTPDGVTFIDKYGEVDIAIVTADTAPTPEGVKAKQVADMIATGHAVDVTGIRTMPLPAGDAVAVDYTSNSALNPVTNRQIRLENRRFYVFHSGQEAVVTMSAPAGADNVDAWKMMADTFRWPS
ncbi:MAG: hypothetical protein KKB02_12150 [Alphaproteobacteria bacterium]|nr:hypothetical protein [Alphaproteobacteria bacterium]